MYLDVQSFTLCL